MTLNQVAQIQAGLQYKPQVQRVPGKWTDANFNDVKIGRASCRERVSSPV